MVKCLARCVIVRGIEPLFRERDHRDVLRPLGRHLYFYDPGDFDLRRFSRNLDLFGDNAGDLHCLPSLFAARRQQESRHQ